MPKKYPNHSYLKPAIIFIMIALGILLSSSVTGCSINYFFYDFFFSINRDSSSANAENNNVIIVAIDEASFKHLIHQWPWPRSWHANLIERLNNEGAKTIAFDIIFADPADNKSDAAFSRTLKKYDNIILAGTQEKTDSGSYVSLMKVKPREQFIQPNTNIGLDIMPLDTDGILRRAYLEFNGDACFGYEAAINYISPDKKAELRQLKNEDPEFFINFSGPPGTFKTISYYQALNPSLFFSENFFKNKLIFVGFYIRNKANLVEIRPDHYPTPFVRFGSGYMPGVEIQANIATNLIRHVHSKEGARHKQLLKKSDSYLLWIISAFFWVITIIAGFYTPVFLSTVLFPLILIAQWAVTFFAFQYFSIYIPFAPMACPSILIYLSGPFFKYYEQLQKKQFIKKTFSRYISPGVVKHLLKSPDKINTDGEYVNATVLYLDIEKFTLLADKIDAVKLTRILSRYLGTFTDIIIKNDGMVDKIAGDAIMAVWGAPLPQKNHAEMACRTSFEIKDALKKLNQKNREKSKPLNIRIGINSGKMLAGNVGGKHFSNYTVHGVGVNLAARLEAINKIYKTRILIGKNTADLLPDIFALRKIDYISLKGWQNSFYIYELTGFKKNIGENTLLLHQFFSRAIELYLNKNFIEAKILFEKALALFPDDGPCNIYIKRCSHFIKTPPGNDWDAVTEI